MLNKVRKNIESHDLLKPGERVIVGFSGGCDSIVLLYILQKLGYDCLAAHCNFHLRGEESNRDEKFALDFASSLNVSFFKQDFDTYFIAKERGISIEMAARDLRYEWFERLKAEWNASAIAVAHHQDDNIETLLLNLIRGTGIRGLTGMKPKNGNIIRPLLSISRKEIEDFALVENLSFVTDSTNLQDEFTRNKIRLQVMPLLETINPSAKDALALTIDNLNEAAQIYNEGIERAIKEVFDNEKGIINISLLKTYPSPESVLFELLKEYGFGKDIVRKIVKSIDSQPGKEFYSSHYCLTKDRDAFFLVEKKEKEKKEYLIEENDFLIELPCCMEITSIVNSNEIEINRNRDYAYLDFDKLQFPLTLRKWNVGDRFVPLGMAGFQKLSDFFNNNKFSKPEKENTWILTSGDDIVWIVNHRIDNRFRVEQNTKKLYILKLL